LALPELEFPSYEECNYPSSLTPELEDNSIKTNMSNGTVKVRPWSTKTRITFNVEFSTRTFNEALILENFYNQVQMYTPFTWTHPTDKDSETNDFKKYGVRFKEPIGVIQEGSRPFVKDISIVLEEV